MTLDHLTVDVEAQAQTGPVAGSVSTIIGLKKPLALVYWNPRAIVAHADLEPISPEASELNVDRAPVRIVADRILEKVVDDLTES